MGKYTTRFVLPNCILKKKVNNYIVSAIFRPSLDIFQCLCQVLVVQPFHQVLACQRFAYSIPPLPPAAASPSEAKNRE